MWETVIAGWLSPMVGRYAIEVERTSPVPDMPRAVRRGVRRRTLLSKRSDSQKRGMRASLLVDRKASASAERELAEHFGVGRSGIGKVGRGKK
jgi:hypothetical protein